MDGEVSVFVVGRAGGRGGGGGELSSLRSSGRLAARTLRREGGGTTRRSTLHRAPALQHYLSRRSVSSQVWPGPPGRVVGLPHSPPPATRGTSASSRTRRPLWLLIKFNFLCPFTFLLVLLVGL